MAKPASVATVIGVLFFAAHVFAQQAPAAAPATAPTVQTATTTQTVTTQTTETVHLAPPPPAQPVHRRVTTPVLVAGGIGIVGLATGTVFGILATADNSKYKSTPDNDTALSGEKKAFVADVAFGVAALFGLTAIALYILPDEPTPTDSAPPAKATARTWLTAALKGEVLSF